MNHKLLAAVVSFSLVACSGRAVEVGTDGPDETSSAVKSPKSSPSGSSTSTPAPAPSSSSGVAEDAPDTDDDGFADASTPTDPTPDAGASDCTPSVSIRCTDGKCTCGTGPNKGKSCNGSSSSGASSCSVLCSFCD